MSGVGEVASFEDLGGDRGWIANEPPRLFDNESLIEGFKVAKPETTVDFTLTNEFICT